MKSSLPICALLALGLFLDGCGHSQNAGRDPESAAGAFFAAIEKGDARTAYDSAAFGFQAAQTFEAFTSNAHEIGLIGGQPPGWTSKDIHPDEARLDGTMANQSGRDMAVSVTMTRDGMQWRLFALRTGARESAVPENRFTLVGKGTGFNDVYHQPMPEQDELAKLIHDTLATFNKAIQTNDFHDFYTSISQQWKNGERNDGGAAEGVTENMLKNHFQGFVEKKIDISGVADAQPVFDRTPIINQDGLLELHGHFDIPNYRVNFDLEYAYELPRWKLFGIDLGLMQR